MTGSQEFTGPAPTMAGSQHSPASTSSVSSTGSYPGGYNTRHNNPPPPRSFQPSGSTNYPPYTGVGPPPDSSTTPLELASTPGTCSYTAPLNCDTSKGQHMPTAGGSGDTSVPPHPYVNMGWESPGGTTHYTAPIDQYQYEANNYPVVITPPNNNGCETGGSGHVTTVTMVNQPPAGEAANRGGPQHTVHFHVHQGEAVSLQLGEQVQMIQGPATVRMVSTNQEPPLPVPMQLSAGHYVQQIVDGNGVLQHVILSPQPQQSYVPIPPYTNGTNQQQNGWSSQPSYVADPNHPPPPTASPYPASPSQPPPPMFWNNNAGPEMRQSKGPPPDSRLGIATLTSALVCLSLTLTVNGPVF